MVPAIWRDTQPDGKSDKEVDAPTKNNDIQSQKNIACSQSYSSDV